MEKGQESLSDLQLYHGIFRINTDISAGDQSVEMVAEYATKAGVDFIVVSDQFLVYAKYGLPPFRHVFGYSMEQKSIVSYGIEKYLNRLEQADRDNPELIIIPGADIAPHYYWTGSLLDLPLTANQFSQQITVFGPNNADLYKKLPVIHNEPAGFFFPGTIIGLLPIILVLAGISLFFKKASEYKDRQGHTHNVPSLKRVKFLGVFLIILGIIWTWNNRPFHQNFWFDQYSPSSHREYQQVIDYIKAAENKYDKSAGTGIIWSAPEATMSEKRSYASLLSIPFVNDIKSTHGYSGFAGIYGDVSNAHKPGNFWDDILLEYCSGKRMNPPVIVGERDYHGERYHAIDFIKTVTLFRKTTDTPKIGSKQIVNAIMHGNSYAVLKITGNEIVLTDVKLTPSGQTETDNPLPGKSANFAIPGETLRIDNQKMPILSIAGKLTGKILKDKNKGTVIVIVDGKKVLSKDVELRNFTFTEQIPVDPGDGKKHYIRFYIIYHSTAALICNPIFLESSISTKH